MKQTFDYTNRATPNFDAIEDIKFYLGEKYDEMTALLKDIKDVQAFGFYCGMIGIEGFPVKAWYDHFHGAGEYHKAWDIIEGEKASD